MKKIQWLMNSHKQQSFSSSIFTLEKMHSVFHFHQTWPGYAPTPLYSLGSLAEYLGVQNILIKDEALRFGLNAFKALGSSYALASYLGNHYGIDLSSFSDLKNRIQDFPPLIFSTTTAGNHGRGLAWAAKQLGQKAMVYLPNGSCINRLKCIRELDAQAEMSALNYDDTVRYVSLLSLQRNWILIQDTSWEGYREIPAAIMQGYLTILGEYLEQLKNIGKDFPTHIILQAGVGSFASALLSGLKLIIKTPVTFIIVEPASADCFFQSALSTDGGSKHASGDLSTIMAGLACKEPNPIAWHILKEQADCFVVCPDDIAIKGMRVLGNPLHHDARIISGESGAVPLGLLYEMCKNPLLADLKNAIHLDSDSRVLFISTEGDTDPDKYRAICWNI